jgi:hypothetical protein
VLFEYFFINAVLGLQKKILLHYCYSISTFNNDGSKFELTYYFLGQVWPEGPQSIDKINLTYAIDTMIGELYVITFLLP